MFPYSIIFSEISILPTVDMARISSITFVEILTPVVSSL